MDQDLKRLMQHSDPLSVNQLFLDNQRIPSLSQIKTDLSRYSSLSKLSLNNVGLSSLEGFPEALTQLRNLVLSDNKIGSGLENLTGKGLVNLVSLDLSNNRISKLEALAPLVI